MSIHTPQQLHEPVLLPQVVELLAPRPGETYLDLTAGYGGHARVVADALGGFEAVTLVDRDDTAVAELEKFRQQGASVIHDDFAHFVTAAAQSGETYDMVLVDFGVSSPQLDIAERGFSFRYQGPLDMRMDRRQSRTAATLCNTLSERDLAKIISLYGEEPPRKAAAIAQAIVRARPLKTTDDLVKAVLSTYRGPRRRKHPATQTFQALRMAVGDELGQIETLLEHLSAVVRPGGRVAFISFHSLEDRLIKRFLRAQAESGLEAEFSVLTKKPVLRRSYDVHNPRARSAILRAAVKK